MRRFVIGDIHGAHKALLQCFERSKFDRGQDLLISLGDVCDGWPEVSKVVDELLRIKNMKLILGNHDAWTLQWMRNGWMDENWTSQGGSATLQSYQNNKEAVPKSHLELFQNAPFYIELGKQLFVHGGLDPSMALHEQDPEFLMWDRELLDEAVHAQEITPDYRYGKWNEIFIGHTPTQVYKSSEPTHACNVWALDTGCGWSGKLTMMDMDTYEYWQSDPVRELYPNFPGRTH